jgi:hypothetical protein
VHKAHGPCRGVMDALATRAGVAPHVLLCMVISRCGHAWPHVSRHVTNDIWTRYCSVSAQLGYNPTALSFHLSTQHWRYTGPIMFIMNHRLNHAYASGWYLFVLLRHSAASAHQLCCKRCVDSGVGSGCQQEVPQWYSQHFYCWRCKSAVSSYVTTHPVCGCVLRCVYSSIEAIVPAVSLCSTIHQSFVLFRELG